MAKQPSNNLPSGRVVNLGFDSLNISNLKDALTDLETAGSDATLISTCKRYLKRVENHYSESVNNLT